MYHTDGAVAPILPDLIEIGLDVFNPVQPNVPGHDPQELKDKFGDRLSFWGAIDQQNLLPNGTPTEIEADVAERSAFWVPVAVTWLHRPTLFSPTSPWRTSKPLSPPPKNTAPMPSN